MSKSLGNEFTEMLKKVFENTNDMDEAMDFLKTAIDDTNDELLSVCNLIDDVTEALDTGV